MSITKTYEPLRPLRCKGDSEAAYNPPILGAGVGRTFYGASYWPSRSYSIWEHEEEAREALRVHTGIAVSK